MPSLTGEGVFLLLKDIRDRMVVGEKEWSDFRNLLEPRFGSRSARPQNSNSSGWPANAGQFEIMQPRQGRLGGYIFNYKGAGAGDNALIVFGGQDVIPGTSLSNVQGGHVLFPNTGIALELVCSDYDGPVRLYFAANGDPLTRILSTEFY